MGKFDGYLICSDFDETLTANGEVVEKNLDRIRYFQENGGLFTVCSGRNCEFIRRFADKFVPNTYVIGVGGSMAMDLRTNEVLFENLYTDEHKRIYDRLAGLGTDTRGLILHFADKNDFTAYAPEEYTAQKEEILKRPIRKAVIVTNTPEGGTELVRLAHEELGDIPCEVVRSYNTCVELIPNENSKGAATRYLKAHLGIHTLICVGDYENDISMIRGADIGYATGNAAEELKAVCDRVTVCAADGAIAAIIDDIECGRCRIEK